jgi:hypothetical protein
VRRDNPEWTTGKDGKPKPDKKYLGAPNSTNRLYIPPGVTLEQLQDLTIPVVIVEGEKKALALWGLAHYQSDKPRFISIAIAGVWNWRGRVGKANGPKGERIDLTGPITDMARIEWKGRIVFVLFDTNVHTNESVKAARKGIARELGTRGALVKFVNLPEDCGVNGVDDLLAEWGPAKVLGLFESAVSGARLEVVLPPQFQSRPAGMFRVTKRAELLTELQLTNYRAAVVMNIQLDDGVEKKREFEMECELMGQPFRFRIPASEFTSMDWPIQQMGAAAITFPNQREYARAAIQWFSLSAGEKSIYTHTGWREVGGQRLYLHAGGAIGGDGPLSDVDVRLLGPMNRFNLQVPENTEQLASAVRASLGLVGLGPAAVCFPLLAATCRAVFGEADFAIHLVGETGAFKSEVAALHQQHFGAQMNRLNLPGAWSSTGNSLEVLAFHAKDALFVIDDFAPQGSSADVARYHAAADRVFRAAGNHAGRGRLDSTAKLREPKPPRALILSTGEDTPRGQSVRARLLILEISKGAIDTSVLTACQKVAEAGLYASAMAGFIQWLAGEYEAVRATFDRRVSQARSQAFQNAAHARTPEIVANLQAAFELYLDFSARVGAIDAPGRVSLAVRCWEALSEAAAAQAKHQAATEPTGRFLSVLRSLLASGKAHLAGLDGEQPDKEPRACGWRCNGGTWLRNGDCVGWAVADAIYLEPITAYRLVQLAASAAGESITVSEHTLKKRLREKGLLASIDETYETLTIRRTLAGSSRKVLHLRRAVVLPEAPDDEDENVG